MKDEMSTLISEMEKAGWTFSLNRKGHRMGKAPDGKTIITMGGSVSDRRAVKNNRALFNKWKRENMAKVFSCAECGNQYNSAQALQGHVRIHTTGEFPCDVCGKVFQWPAALGRHKTAHKPKPDIVTDSAVVIQTNGLPENFNPPSASLNPPDMSAGKPRDSWDSIITDLLTIVERIETLSKTSDVRSRILAMLAEIDSNEV